MTTKINIDVKFKTPEAAALGFGLLYHAAGVGQSGCRGQLVVGMTDEATADNFIAHALRDDRAREAAIGLAGRIMEDSLRAIADGLELGEETSPIVLDREPAQQEPTAAFFALEQVGHVGVTTIFPFKS